MIFADKLRELRKKSGWSQEELAEQMNVTRQSVSKWEGAQAIPDLDKILKLSKLFGVSIDYLLKDDIEDPMEVEEISEKYYEPLRQVTMEEVVEYLEIKRQTANYIAYATLLCILSPIGLILLSAISNMGKYNLANNVAVGLGLIILVICIIIAVTIYILSGSKTSTYDFLEDESFETEYGVSGMVKERQNKFRGTYIKNNIIGVCITIASIIPIFVGMIIGSENDFLWAILISIMFILVGLGTTLFIKCGIVWESYNRILKEGNYKIRGLHKYGYKYKYAKSISSAYWMIVTGIYLIYSFIADSWDTSWFIWIVASILYSIFLSILNVFNKKEEMQ